MSAGISFGQQYSTSIYFAFYVFYPDPDTIQTKLKGYETNISFAGLALFIVSLMGLWKLLKDAYKPASKEPSGTPSYSDTTGSSND